MRERGTPLDLAQLKADAALRRLDAKNAAESSTTPAPGAPVTIDGRKLMSALVSRGVPLDRAVLIAARLGKKMGETAREPALDEPFVFASSSMERAARQLATERAITLPAARASIAKDFPSAKRVAASDKEVDSGDDDFGDDADSFVDAALEREARAQATKRCVSRATVRAELAAKHPSRAKRRNHVDPTGDPAGTACVDGPRLARQIAKRHGLSLDVAQIMADKHLAKLRRNGRGAR
jgi:hypothetical protein